MTDNLGAAHKKTDLCAAHEALLAFFLQSCSTQSWISCSTQSWISCSTRNRPRMLYTKDNSRVTSEFSPSNSTKIQEHTRVAPHECQLRNELYHSFRSFGYVCGQFIIMSMILYVEKQGCNMATSLT